MDGTRTKENPVRLSHSSANLLRSCEQKYVHYKVLGTEIDSDATKENEFFQIGKAVHFILEMMNHVFDSTLFEDWLEKAVDHFEVEHHKHLVAALSFKMFKMQRIQGLMAIKCEYEIKTDSVLGYIDLIAEDEDMNWWIIDLKTASRFYELTYSKLANDYQLNLYASFVKDIAKELNLDANKFMGCRYRVVTKSQAKPKKNETIIEYIKRTNEVIRCHEVIIPKEELEEKEIRKDHIRLQKRAQKLFNGTKPTRNYNNCGSYFRPCEYWSQCHKQNFTDCKTYLEIEEC